MSIIDDAKAAGFPVWDGKTPHKCHDCDFVTSSFREYTRHLSLHYPPVFTPHDDPLEDPVFAALVSRSLRALFTGDFTEGIAAVVDFGTARRKS